MDFETMHKNFINQINENLNYFIESYIDKNIREPIKYSINAGGKRFRPILFLATIDAFKKDYKNFMSFAIAIEFIHTYSLIHDDLPCIDNDDFRRGVLTLHKKFDEATALLAGDALLNASYEIMIQFLNENFEKKYAKAIYEIALSAGSKGMIGGQALDTLCKTISKEELNYIHKNKTGKLIYASIISASIISDANTKEIALLTDIAFDIGLSFQIKDDLLDIIGDENVLGKPILSDIKNEKNTYVSLHGLENAKKDYISLSKKVLKNFETIGFKNKFIYKYIENLIDRQN